MTTTSLATVWSEQTPYHTALEALQRLHWSVFPLDEEKRPPALQEYHSDGTPKRLAWKSLQSRHVTPDELRHWDRLYAPSAWAVVTGAISGVLILDFDIPDGQRTRERLGLQPHVLTGSGGAHVYFRHPGWPVATLNHKANRQLGTHWPGLDIRADGGYGAFCGRNRSGPYIWVRDPIPDEVDLLPEDLRAFLGLLHPPESKRRRSRNTAPQEEPVPPSPSPASTSLARTLLKRALQLVNDHEGRNNAGFWLACQLRDNHVSRADAEKVMRAYAGRVPSTNSKGLEELYQVEEALASLESAYREEAREAWSELATPSPDSQGNGGGAGRHDGIQTATPDGPDGGDALPEIIVGVAQLRELTDLALNSVMRKEYVAPSLFLQSSRLVRVGHNEMKHPIVASMATTEVKEVLTHAANYYRLKKLPGTDEEEYRKVPVPPPKDVAEQILARQTQYPYLPFPPLQAIVETPVIRPDGSILDTPGYDSATRLYYAPHPELSVRSVPVAPTKEEQEAALALIWETIGEFPYVGEADRANALGLLLTPMLRPTIQRHVPLALLDAPKPGTGKGLFADVVSIIATGDCAAILTAPDNEEEWDKRITAMLMQGRTIICIDNLAGQLQSAKLDAVLTATLHEGRILGQSTMVKVPNRATWMATGNNVKIGGDLARRCYRIRFDPHVSRPWMRQGFKHEDLATWVTEQRGALIGALLTLARAWYAAGQPVAEGLPALGTFTGWVKTVGSIVSHAGVQGFLSNLEQLYEEADEESVQWEQFLSGWRDLFREEWMTTQHIIAQLEQEGAGSVLVDALPEGLALARKDKPLSFAICLGKALERQIGTCYGSENIHLERKLDTHKKRKVWRVVAGSAGSNTPAHGKNSEIFSDQNKNNNSNDRDHYPHYPQPSNTTFTSNGSTGQSKLDGGCDESSQALPATDQLPAHENESEEFTL
ncbi:hypothetical protein KSF_015710 [Reticulibacter mediterranei]|uniref:DNA primase/polymerase bifunctional N-terminal domain-containing protein n=1 Tax=Reticulibacter mediterranei TaxID=2778369 RepID=A0A8J3N0I5_9CHLR|nr:bifunctional DNA primase/polymerase [Reticulibacter mediterranei]GHO91523.1 hypothetical protein KSF_015710 [Reticulibacter mediterranei]